MAYEIDAEITELLQCRDKRAERAGEAVVLPHQHAVEAAPTCIRHERLELGRASTFTHVPRCLVDIFAGDREAAVLGIEAQLAQLRCRALLAPPLQRSAEPARRAAQGLENP